MTSLITDWVVQYGKNPAKNQYYEKTTHTSTARANYGFNANENKKEIKLKYLNTAIAKDNGNRNDSFLNYYDAMLGDVKQIISFIINDPEKSNAEVGDVCVFSNMKIDPMSSDWTGKQFIITETKRSIGGQLGIKAREI